MAAATKKRQKREVLKSPFAPAVFPHLNKPDTYEGKSKYKVALRLDPKNPEHAAFIAAMTERLNAGFEKMKAEDPKNAAKMRVEYPVVTDEVDKQGNASGFVLFRTSMNSSFEDKETGKIVRLQPKLFDAKNNPIPDSVAIYGGSLVRVAFNAVPFALKAKDVGLSCKIVMVQVKQLASRNAVSVFDTIDDGYEVEDDEAGTKPSGDEF